MCGTRRAINGQVKTKQGNVPKHLYSNKMIKNTNHFIKDK